MINYPLELPVLDTWGPWVIGGALLMLYLFEQIWTLRPWRYHKKRRMMHNVALSLIGLPAARLLLLPLTFIWAAFLEEQAFGLLNLGALPYGFRLILGALALDYGIYLWHRLNHRWSFLWRFHNVHHVDLDMDLSTGLRFHFGEMLLSIPFRLLVIALVGVPPMAILYYEVLFEVATLFHHSNWRLPKKLEEFLAYFMITPRQHGIHHSVVQQETNSNYGTVLNLWDRLHRSGRRDVLQQNVTIGVPAYRDEKELQLGYLLLLPFRKQRPWEFPDGQKPRRSESEKGQGLVDH